MTETLKPVAAGATGTETTRFNATRHGILSRYTVLPWEEGCEYAALLAALTAEHRPDGPTEEHLVEELAGIFWRKRRLRQAEAAAHQHGLDDATGPYCGTVKAALAHVDAGLRDEHVGDAIHTTPEQTQADVMDLEEDEGMTDNAVAILDAGGPEAYAQAVEALRDDTRRWWRGMLERDPAELDHVEGSLKADVQSLRRFVEEHVRPCFEERRKELEHRPLIRAQAIGQSFDANRLSNLARYEVHLDRKLERTLAMLIKLQDLRASSDVL